MVAGDLVNTASRIQSIADPGTVLVGEATRRTTDQTIVYAEAGSHELKGKVGLVPLWQALRVIAGARGSLKSTGLEAPFVGRDGELRRIKDLFHTCADDRKPQLSRSPESRASASRGSPGSSTSTSTGSPRSRTGTEGAASPTERASRTGRSLTWSACGHGSPRTRSRPRRWRSSRGSSRSTCPTPTSDALSSRASAPARPRGAARASSARTCSQRGGFLRAAGGRLPDGHGLRGHAVGGRLAARLHRVPARVVTELTAVRRDAGAARAPGPPARPGAPRSRNFTSIYLEPLPEPAMEELLAGLVPGLPGLRHQILERAEGIPLYAVETVRMLLDRGALVQEGSVYRPTGHGRGARGSRDAARADRRPARRIERGGAARDAGRRRARQDVHEAGARGRLRPLRAGARSASGLVDAQGAARRPGRPAHPRARTVRLPPGSRFAASPTRRWPRATARHGTSRRPRYLEQAWGSTRSSRCRVPLPRCL